MPDSQPLSGTPSQIEWAELIRPRVNAEFTRVAKAFGAVAAHQTDANRLDTLTILSILEEKRSEVMANSEAGYFIRHWQELSDQVRQIIARDPRYKAIKANRPARREPA